MFCALQNGPAKWYTMIYTSFCALIPALLYTWFCSLQCKYVHYRAHISNKKFAPPAPPPLPPPRRCPHRSRHPFPIRLHFFLSLNNGIYLLHCTVVCCWPSSCCPRFNSCCRRPRWSGIHFLLLLPKMMFLLLTRWSSWSCPRRRWPLCPCPRWSWSSSWSSREETGPPPPAAAQDKVGPPLFDASAWVEDGPPAQDAAAAAQKMKLAELPAAGAKVSFRNSIHRTLQFNWKTYLNVNWNKRIIIFLKKVL